MRIELRGSGRFFGKKRFIAPQGAEVSGVTACRCLIIATARSPTMLLQHKRAGF